MIKKIKQKTCPEPDGRKPSINVNCYYFQKEKKKNAPRLRRNITEDSGKRSSLNPKVKHICWPNLWIPQVIVIIVTRTRIITTTAGTLTLSSYWPGTVLT